MPVSEYNRAFSESQFPNTTIPVSEYNRRVSEYNRRVSEYNRRVSEYNRDRPKVVPTEATEISPGLGGWASRS